MNHQTRFLLTTKTIVTTALILALTLAVFVADMNYAQAGPTYQTTAFLAIIPNPAQVNTPVFVSFWLQPYSPGVGILVYHNFTVLVTDPTGSTVTKGPFAANPNAGGYFSFTPTMTGTYSFKFNYPGEYFPTVDRTYLESETPTVTLVVQQEPIQHINGPGTPLPTGYWTRPISAEMREWTAISGNWLMGGYDMSGHIRESATGLNPYTTAPKTAHIMWTKYAGGTGQLGGLVGGELGDKAYFAGLPYYHPVYPPIILEGKLYYNLHESSSGSRGPYPGFVCVDLRTGEELWRNTTGYIDVGQVWYVRGIDETGAYAFLWATVGSTWTAYDPQSGDVMFTFANATTAATNNYRFGEDGTLFAYVNYNARPGQGPTHLMWNSTKAFYENRLATLKTETSETGTPISVVSGFIPRPGTYDWQRGIEWNITQPVLPGGNAIAVTPSMALQFPRGASGVRIGKVGGSMDVDQIHAGYDWTTGQQLWVEERSIAGVGSRGLMGDGIYAVHDTSSRSWIAYDIKTGEQLWVSDPMKFPWGAYSSYAGTVAYDLVYTLGYDGYAYAYDITNGETVWEFYSGDDLIGDTPYGLYPMFGGPVVGGEVVFASNGEHTPNMPLYRGEKLFALDALTGEHLWNISGWLAPKALADGYLVAFNGYDNLMYTFGKGPSATSVVAPLTAVQVGQSFTIAGTVLDMSPGKPGTPAISDEYMSEWMEYLWMQRQIPEDVKGVTVKLTATDPNNNNIVIGEATSDKAGNFGFMWSAEVPGLYQITATFEGSESYGSSYATTYVSASAPVVSPLPTTTPPAGTSTPLPTIAPTTTVSPSPVPNAGNGIGTEVYLAIAAAVVIVAVASAALILRKRE